jgi:hypothetical protein
MGGKHVAAQSPRQRSGWRRFERPFAVLGAAAVLVVGIESVSVAATGSTFILGRSNTASSTTVLTTTKAGSPALSLRTKSKTTAPFTTNARGKVVNLNSDKVDGLDASAIIAAGRTGGSADTLGGKTAAQLVAQARTNVDATKVGGKTPSQIVADARSSIIAFAIIASDGTVVRGTPGIVVSRPNGTGFTCLTVPGFSPTSSVAVVGPEWLGSATQSGTPGTKSIVEASREPSSFCPSGNFLVASYTDNGTSVTLTNQAFSIIITA